MADNMYDEKKEMIYNNNINNVDYRTNYSKGIYYKGADGREYATMDEVRVADKAYWDSQKKDTSKNDAMISYIGKDGRKYHTSEALERATKAYFDYLNFSFNTYDENMSQDDFKARQEEILSYIRERYGDYLDKLLEKYGYGSQEAGKGPKK